MKEANWEYISVSVGVQIWSWHARRGTRYMVTEGPKCNIEAHVTTGTSYRAVITIGAFATVKEAKAKCEEHYNNQNNQLDTRIAGSA